MWERSFTDSSKAVVWRCLVQVVNLSAKASEQTPEDFAAYLSRSVKVHQ